MGKNSRDSQGWRSGTCIVDGCQNPGRARHYCTKHYAKWIKYGAPTVSITKEQQRVNLIASHTRYRNPISVLDPTPDTRKGQRGYLAVKLISQVKVDAKKVGHTWTLTDMETYTLLTAPCTYCGLEPDWPRSRSGIDRVDSSKEYESDNCVAACMTCNAAKRDKSVESFMAWVRRIYAFNFQRTSNELTKEVTP